MAEGVVLVEFRACDFHLIIYVESSEHKRPLTSAIDELLFI